MKLKLVIGLLIIGTTFSCVRSTVDTSLNACEITVAYTVGDPSSGNLQVKSILDNSCAYSGCHDGSSAPGDFRMYGADIEAITLESDKFKTRVFEVVNMPPDTISDSRKLSQNDLQTLECWVTGGFINEG